MKRSKPLPRSRKPLRRSPIKRQTIYRGSAWARLKRDVRKRSRGICEVCGLRPMTAVHHRSYALGSGVRKIVVPLEELTAICDICHAQIHPHLRFG
jgi:5-methylcytosine-specific restriction endonuclease McrA